MHRRLAALAIVSLALVGGLATRFSVEPRYEREPELRAIPSIPPLQHRALESSAEAAREAIPPAQISTTLRGRVVSDTGEPIADCSVGCGCCGGAQEWVTTGDDGRFEFTRPFTVGSGLWLTPPEDWELEKDELELDALPTEELTFVAHFAPVARGIVRGTVVDELDGAPVPYFRLSAGSETLETDAAGQFVGRELHPEGQLDFTIASWSYELNDFDPRSAQPLVVPARVGPAIYFEVERAPQDLYAVRLPVSPAENAPAFGVSMEHTAMPRSESPRLVRFQALARNETLGGELVLLSSSDLVVGRAALGPGRGTASEPLRVSFRPCALLEVDLRFSRLLEWYEFDDLEFCLASRSGVPEASQPAVLGACGTRFVVVEPGEFWLEARFRGELVGRELVSARLGEGQRVVLTATLPERAVPTEPEEERLPVRVEVVSERNEPVVAQLRLTRVGDGDEELLQVAWTKTGGRWLGRIAEEIPAGEYRAKLESDTHFTVTGPSRVRVPDGAELRYVLDDDVPLVDVYLAPVAAESGEPLLTFDAEADLDDGDTIAGDGFWSPGRPLVEGHPSNVPFTWTCSARGRQAASGRCESATAEGGKLTIRVALERGWGALLYVGGEDYAPVAGAEVFVDGARAGVTGPEGRLCLTGTHRPSKISVQFRDWQIDDGHVQPDGSFDDADSWMNVYLRPVRGR